MMNIFALWMVFATLGAVSVVFPEQSVVELQQQQPWEAAKGAAKESLHYAVDAARQTGEGIRNGIRQKVISASDIPAKTADAVKHVGADVAQVVKDGSQSGLEKIGLARPEKKSYSEIIKDEAGDVYHATKDAAGETVEAAEDKVRKAARAVQDGAVNMGEWVEGGVKGTYRKVEEDGFAAKETVCSTAGRAQEKVTEGADLVAEKASGVYQSVDDRFNAAAGKASEEAGSVYEHSADCLKGSAEAAKECTSSYGEKIKHVSQQAADIVKGRVAEAASLLPNVGQGLAYKTNDAQEATTTADLNDNAVNDSVKGLTDTASFYHEDAKEKASEAQETVRETMNAAVDGARDTTEQVFDITDSSRQEAGQQLNDSMVEARYNLTERTPDGELSLKNKAVAVFNKLRWITARYFFGSCRAAHLFTFSSVYGSSLWVTFLSGYILSRAIPRQQFGFVQSRIFPTYLRVAASGHAICLVLFMILHPWPNADRDEKLQHLDLWAILASTLANIFFLEPRATKAMFQKLKLEKEEGRGQDGLGGSEDDETKASLAIIDKNFVTFHGYSSLANLLSMIGMTWHLWHLSRRLVV